LRRLLSSFQSNLEEVTLIARPDDEYVAGRLSKAVQLKSYCDPGKGEQSTAALPHAIGHHIVLLSLK